MKKIILLLLVVTILTSCDRSLDMIHHSMELEKQIDYSKDYEEIKPEIDIVLESFDKCIEKYPHIWKRGYNQKCQYLKGLYCFYHKIGEGLLMQEYQKVFDAYLAKNKIDDDVHACFQYAMFKKYQGKNEMCLKFLRLIYKPNWKYTFLFDDSSLIDGYLISEDVINFIAGNLLGQIDRNRFKGTGYEQIFELGGRTAIFNLM